MKFVTDVFSREESNVVAVGVDCPDSLRDVSQLVEPFDIISGRNMLENIMIYDSGDVEIGGVESSVSDILSKDKLPLILATPHTVTLHAMKSVGKNAKLVVWDAHADVKDEYEGSKHSHACWLRRLIESGFDPDDVVILGLRSGDREEFEFLKSEGIDFFSSIDIKRGVESVKKRLENWVSGSKFYMSVDMDVFDPSIAPAVKYPEPDGISYREFLSILESLEKGKLIGMDCVEIIPIPKNRITEFMAVKSIFKTLEKLL